ncbi:MAG: FtsQ-type POTRA domain-containing protein [Patescibacteria group bacterium]|nr:FtsQ-type POTRA domain-containing protein [Patescibacteria group bacterium]
MIFRRGRNQKKKQNRRRTSVGFVIKKTIFWIIFIGFWVVAFWTLFLSDVMRVGSIVVNSSRAEKEEIRCLARNEIAGMYLDALPKDNLLIIPRRAIIGSLHDSFIFIKNVQVTRSFPKTIEISVEERESHMIWCNGYSCALVDEQAEAFYNLEPETNEVAKDLVKITDTSGEEITIGSRVASPTFIRFCENLPQTVQQQAGIAIGNDLETPSSMSEEVQAITSDGWKILFSTNRPIEIQGKVLEKILNETITFDRKDKIEYIDLRIKGKTTFKLKNEDDDDKDENENDGGDKEDDSGE